jgi:aspartyl-tRNA(Asn)/glutamyl-tRNA(Gln) amidotransferase subunit A
MANSVEDVALLLGAVAGADAGDATCATSPAEDYAAALLPAAQLASRPLAGVRLGLVRETASAGCQPAVAAALASFAAHAQSLGAEIVDVSLPSFALGLPAYYVIAPAEASSNLARYDGLRFGPQEARPTVSATMAATRGALFGDEVKRRILMGTYALSAGYYDAYYARAQRVRTLIRAEFAAALATCDALLTPAAPTAAYALGAKTADPLAMYAGDLTTVNVNLAGLPAIALPWGLAPPPEGAADAAASLPVGVQLIGRDFGERELLRIAHAAEVTAPPLGAPPGFAGPA